MYFALCNQSVKSKILCKHRIVKLTNLKHFGSNKNCRQYNKHFSQKQDKISNRVYCCHSKSIVCQHFESLLTTPAEIFSIDSCTEIDICRSISALLSLAWKHITWELSCCVVKLKVNSWLGYFWDASGLTNW